MTGIANRTGMSIDNMQKSLSEPLTEQTQNIEKDGRIFHFGIEQGTEDWYKIRMGKITASKANLLLVEPTPEKETHYSLVPDVFTEKERMCIKSVQQRTVMDHFRKFPSSIEKSKLVTLLGLSNVTPVSSCVKKGWVKQSEILTYTKGGAAIDQKYKSLGVGAVTYARNLAAEQYLMSSPQDNVKSEYSQWGHDNEPYALAYMNTVSNNSFQAIGFVEYGRFGASPDGWDHQKFEGAEVKSFNKELHAGYLEDITLLSKQVYPQVQWSMMVTGAKKWMIGCYHPSFKEGFRSRTAWIDRDDDYIELLRTKANLLIDLSEHFYERLSSI